MRFLALALIAAPHAALADDEPLAAPTSTKLERRALQGRPRMRAIDLLRHVPGLAVLGQAGNAPTYLVRGFDAGHGAAMGVDVDGVSINEGSHAYAHGYADTGLVIPETVESIELHEGAYAARFDSFSVGGHLDVRTIDRVEQPVVRLTEGVEVGADALWKYIDTIRPRYRMVGMFSPEIEQGAALLAAEVGVDDGPFIHRQNLRRGAVLAKLKRRVGAGMLSTSFNFYSGRWFESGQLSATAIESGRLTPLSSADPTQGGIAQRASAQASYEIRDRRGATWSLSAFAVDASHRLYKNSSLFVRDALRGDQIEYDDSRVYYGFEGFYRRRHRLGWMRGQFRVGIQTRVDNIETETWHSARRLRLVDCFDAINPCTDMEPALRGLGLYAEETLDVTKWLRVFGGARFEQQAWSVDDVDSDTRLGSTTLGGTGSRARVSPKLGVRVALGATEVWLLGGRGVFNTDSRAAVDHNGYGAYVRHYSGELGARIRPDEAISFASSAWVSGHLEHTEWVPDEATSIRDPRALRYGLDWRLTFTPASWLAFDGAVSIARGQLRSGPTAGSLLVNAPRLIAHAGVAANWRTTFGSLRLRALGPRATYGTSHEIEGHALVDLVMGHRWRMFDVNLTVENLLDASWREIQTAGIVRTSRRVEITPDLLVTTGLPRTVWLTLGYTL